MQIRLLLILTFLLLGFGCTKIPPTVPEIPNPDQVEKEVIREQTINEWQEVAENIERLNFIDDETQTNLILYRLNDQLSFRFVEDDQGKLITGWAEALPLAKIIINGVYFHEDMMPSGLLISDGVQIGERKFDKDRSTFLSLKPEIKIIDTKTETIDFETVVEGAQSYPLLISHGQTAIETDSGLLARRSFIGIDQNKDIYLGIAPKNLISLHELAELLLKMDIEWDNVLNLDGGNSTGLIIITENFNETFESYTQVPNIIMVE